ncbi:MAG: hypothetical protein ACXVCS_22085, partial [Bdellovibrionota bacterium]
MKKKIAMGMLLIAAGFGSGMAIARLGETAIGKKLMADLNLSRESENTNASPNPPPVPQLLVDTDKITVPALAHTDSTLPPSHELPSKHQFEETSYVDPNDLKVGERYFVENLVGAYLRKKKKLKDREITFFENEGRVVRKGQIIKLVKEEGEGEEKEFAFNCSEADLCWFRVRQLENALLPFGSIKRAAALQDIIYYMPVSEYSKGKTELRHLFAGEPTFVSEQKEDQCHLILGRWDTSKWVKCSFLAFDETTLESAMKLEKYYTRKRLISFPLSMGEATPEINSTLETAKSELEAAIKSGVVPFEKAAEIELKEIPALIKERDNAINEKKEEQLEKSRQREEKRAAELKAREESYKSLPPDEADRQRKLDAQIDDGDQEDQACFQ